MLGAYNPHQSGSNCFPPSPPPCLCIAPQLDTYTHKHLGRLIPQSIDAERPCHPPASFLLSRCPSRRFSSYFTLAFFGHQRFPSRRDLFPVVSSLISLPRRIDLNQSIILYHFRRLRNSSASWLSRTHSHTVFPSNSDSKNKRFLLLISFFLTHSETWTFRCFYLHST
jgi:hypothetical protein